MIEINDKINDNKKASHDIKAELSSLQDNRKETATKDKYYMYC